MDDSRELTPQLSEMLEAYEEYRESLIGLYRRLDISTCYASSPETLLAGLIVAQVVGGVALPIRPGFLTGAEVIGPKGERVQAYATVDGDGMFDGFNIVVEGDRFDVLAMVAFVDARPVAVHLIPRDRLPEVCEYFGRTGGRFGTSLPIAVLTHAHFLLEPVLAAAMGVDTVLLVEEAQECRLP